MRKLLGIIGIVLFLIAWLNFTVFWIVAVCIGGDAALGKVEDGRYYLGSHGTYTQVSPQVWRYSRIHRNSTLITHAVGMVVAPALMWFGLRKRPHNPSAAMDRPGGLSS